MNFQEEVLRRRTFAIISHPDAGKTTLTEKLLFHGGAIHKAGEVKGKAGSKAATSDWMALEQQRGISITSSVMQYEFNGKHVNLLDTPGHKDFSEDTYRTLTAADSATMLIDVAKGVELQTKKLYEVCRYRQIPIFTFVNKVDREGKVPLELLDEVESTLKMTCHPLTWPIGIGGTFYGLYNRYNKTVEAYTVKDGEVSLDKYSVSGPEDPILDEKVEDERILAEFREEMELVDATIGDLTIEEVQSGKISPLTWGSAKYDFGVTTFMEIFNEYALGPAARESMGEKIPPTDKTFTGFVFKVQANMDKKHRDRVAYIRICSGQFERGMKVKHMRLNKEVRLAYSNQFFADERTTVDRAFAGDIIGVNDTSNFRVGDNVSSGKKVNFGAIPRFSPEFFSRIRLKDVSKKKHLEKALKQLSEEGSIQLFIEPQVGWQDPIIGVVGELQFEVILHRFKEEYNLDVRLDRSSYTVARWPRTKEGEPYLGEIKGSMLNVIDSHEEKVILLEKEWDLNWAQRENPEVVFATSIEPSR